MIKRLLLFFIMLLFCHTNYAQNYNMTTNAVYQTCSGNFYDNGGPNGDYGNALTQVVTFCPDFPESAIQVNFFDFDLQDGNDFLFVYDGPDVNSPLLYTLTGTEIPLSIVASGANTTGCLTFRFISDAQTTGRGWEAEVECVTPCQVIMAYLDYSFPARDANGIIKACKGQEITLGAQATFSGNGAGSTYTWDFDNGASAVGQNVSVIYNTPGIYRVNVLVTDTFDCRNNNIINQVIQISPDPVTTIDLPPEICYGVDTIVTTTAEYERITRECAPPVSGTTFLPDGNNNIYSTSVTIDCFENDQLITSASDLKNVCVNMEHSFSNDITIRLISPNGEIVRLHNRGGGGTYIGQANDDGTLEPGIGETYCFTMASNTTLINAPTIQGGSPPAAMYVPGEYKPIDSYDNFIGSPVNGVWTLQVHDQAAIDNGYIFWWALEFSEDILPAAFTFQPEFETIIVPIENGVIDVTTDQFTINPEIDGQLCYEVIFKNDFGCEYTETVCTNVSPQIILGQPREFVGCADTSGNFTFDFQPVFSDLSSNQLLVFSIHTSEEEANEALNAIATVQTQNVSYGVVTYWVRAYNVNTGCFKVTSFTAQAVNCTLVLVNLPDMSICEGEINSFNIGQYSSVVYNNNLGYSVTYYHSEADALNQSNAIDVNLLSNYVGTNNETIWVRVNDINNAGHFGITSFKLFIYPVPETYVLTPVYACEIPGTGLGTFNLSNVQSQASGVSPNIEVSFYQTYAEAEIGEITTSLPLVYTGYQGTIYVRAYNPNTGCFSIMSLITNVVDAPGANLIEPLEVCDVNNDGFAVFNLIPTTVMIAGNPIPQGVLVTYHETLVDATNNTNKIQNIGEFQNSVVNQQTLYVRVGYANSTCSAIVPLTLKVNPTPVIATPTPLQACDSDNNGVANFNLTSKISEVLNGLNPLDYNVTFYTTEANANSGTNPITDLTNYSNLTSSNLSIRVENIETGCFKITKLNLITNPSPVVANPIPTYQLCDDNFDGFQVFDIASKIPSIVGSQLGLQVTFHYSLSDANSGTNPLASPYQNVVQNVQTLFVRVQRLSTGCFTVSTMDIRVNPAPVLNVPVTPFDVCSNTDTSFGTINLSSYNAQFLNGGPAYELKYFETQANAQNNVLPILNPDSYNNLQANNPSVWVRATNTVTGCFSVYKVNFRLLVSPKMPVTLPDVVACDVQDNLFDGITPINLDQQTALILAAQTIPGNYQVRYFTSLVQANLGTNWIANPQAYMNTTNPQTFWVRVQNAAHPTTCFEVKSFNVIVNTPLQLGLPSPIALCDNGLPNDQQTSFDLTIRQNQITQGQIFGVTLKYYLTEAEAKVGYNPILNPTAYTNISNPQTIWVAVENMHGCMSYTTLTIRVLPLPTPNFSPAPLQMCETGSGSAQAMFDLSSAQTDLSNGNATLSYKYFITEQDALNNVGAIATPEGFLSGSSTIYVRVSNTPTILSESCSVVVPLQLIVNSLPSIGQLTPLYACELNTDGVYTFDLRDKYQQILGNQVASNFDIRFYVTETAALLGEAPIPYIYTNAAPDLQTVWVRIQNKQTGCYKIGPMDLKVEEKVFAYPPSASLAFCDTDGVNDGFGPANITSLTAGIISTQNLTPQLAVRYYSSWANYNSGISSTATTFPVSSNPQLVIAEVYNTEPGSLCTATVEFYITMSKAPSFDPIPNGYVCTDFRTGSVKGYLMDTELSPSGLTFTWLQNGTVLEANGPSFMATSAGTYMVVVTSDATGCSASQTINVLAGVPISIDEVKISEGFSETSMLEVIASAPANVELEYALDEGGYQASNIFTDVAPGTHTVWVKVKGSNSCAASKVVNVLNYPKFFTPNNDGYNDTWNIFALKDQPEAKIYIFDRQGKLIKQLSPAGEGWDGTFNNKPLPSTDYWFRAEYIEPNTGLQKEATGHFSLKR